MKKAVPKFKREKIANLDDDFEVKLLHSLRSPLACIKEAVGLALDGLCGPLNRKQTKILKIAMKHIKKLVEIMEGILKEDKRN